MFVTGLKKLNDPINNDTGLANFHSSLNGSLRGVNNEQRTSFGTAFHSFRRAFLSGLCVAIMALEIYSASAISLMNSLTI